MPFVSRAGGRLSPSPNQVTPGTLIAFPRGMMTIFFVVLALLAAALFTEIIAANRAPFGYEDENGFHFGNQRHPRRGPVEFENPS